ncbi:MAG: hypothetical protein E7052_05615 [Lentisphaerae bacterium]|nr:hypothetical protein [Lentisphaerota bacterium]
MKKINTTVSKIRHYTIVEMMMVIAVFMIILSMAMVAWLNSGSQSRAKNAARLLSAQLNLARAKAVSERTDIGVFFSTGGAASAAAELADSGDPNPYKEVPACRLYYMNVSTGKRLDYVDNSQWHTLSGGIGVYPAASDISSSFQPSGAITDNTFWIIFGRKGEVKAAKDKNGNIHKDNKNMYNLIVVEGSEKSGSIPENAPYFVLSVNHYTGRITTKYCEAE